jgi:hypothetical protein
MGESDGLQANEFDREEYDHGTDEYVSARNRLPFSESVGKPEPMGKKETTYGVLSCFTLSTVLCGGACGVYKLIGLLIH